MKDKPVNEKVREIFSAYLEKNDHRKTAERFAILDEIYAENRHFDADSLYTALKSKNLSISRATVYNTLDLLLECELITKHLFENNIAQYERSLNYKQHDHLICEDCGHVMEFCDPRIQQIQAMMGDILRFNITHHSLNLYGKCQRLTESGKCEFNRKAS